MNANLTRRSALRGTFAGAATIVALPLLDCYLDFGDRLRTEEERRRAQQFATGAVECRSLLRATMK